MVRFQEIKEYSAKNSQNVKQRQWIPFLLIFLFGLYFFWSLAIHKSGIPLVERVGAVVAMSPNATSKNSAVNSGSTAVKGEDDSRHVTAWRRDKRIISYAGAVSDERSPVRYTDKSLRQIMDMPPIPFLRNYSSPCFIEPDGRLVCLNAFFLAGFPKSATTDLYRRMTVHRHIEAGYQKEHFWWHSAVNSERKTLSTYTRLFSSATKRLQDTIAIAPDGRKYHPHLIGEFCPCTVHRGNPKATADCIGRILPFSKIIISLRHPVSRTLSDVRHFWDRRSPFTAQNVHKKLSDSVDWFHACVQQHSEDVCIGGKFSQSIRFHSRVSNRTMYSLTPPYRRFLVSFHYFYLRQWLQNPAIKQENVLLLSFEDYIKEPNNYINNVVLPFINAETYSASELNRLENQAEKKRERFIPANETLHLLDKFFKPYNRKLYELIKDDRFLWWLS